MTPPKIQVDPLDKAGIRGFLHRPAEGAQGGIVLTHGAGYDCTAPVLLVTANALASAGWTVLRCDLPFRQRRRRGPPHPGDGAGDRAGLRIAADMLRELVGADVMLGGHSYGGRQASMLVAEEPAAATGLLLLSYPLHPPDKPDQLRIQHFAQLRAPSIFVHGAADPFGTIAEMKQAIAAIPAPARLIAIEGAGHDLGGAGFRPDPVVAALR